jgi:hypothetical protein
MLSCTPGIVFATLSGLSIVASAFQGWKVFLSTLLFHTVLMWGVHTLCKGCHTKALWWILALYIALPVLLGVLYLEIISHPCSYNLAM